MDHGIREEVGAMAVTTTTKEFIGDVEKIPLDSIRPSAHNPRGVIEKNENYLRLTSSINQVGVLVPIVVRELGTPANGIKYELVDGERRFWAAKECRKKNIPAHILTTANTLGDLRKIMFHTHMTRENWSALAQCRALSEVYPKLATGLRFSEKGEWVKKLSEEIVMGTGTARDRVHFLSWPKFLKDQVYAFDESDESKDIYSYVLAIEVSVVEQSRIAFEDFYNHQHAAEYTANKVRASLLHKTIGGLASGAVSSREQIRNISPLFSTEVPPGKKRTALSLFKHFIAKPDIQFDDLRADISAKLPEALREKPPKPHRVIAQLRTVERMVTQYDPSFIDDAVAREKSRKKLRAEFTKALDDAAAAIKNLRAKF
jgi:ParB-like nuclease domain